MRQAFLIIAVFLTGTVSGVGQTFKPASVSSVCTAARVIKVADFNEDGRPDLVMAGWVQAKFSPSTYNCAEVRLGDGAGGFQQSYAEGDSYAYSQSLAVADFNGDGHLDFVVGRHVANSEGSDVGVRLGKGDGSFHPTLKTKIGDNTTASLYSMAVADFDLDGHVDVVTLPVLTETTYPLIFLRGKGDGTLYPAVEIPAVRPRHVVTADLNGDGLPDLVVQNAPYSGAASVLSIFLNENGSFPTRTDLPATTNEAYSLNVVDIDNDAKLDIITSYPRVTYRGNGDGTFQAPTTTNSPNFLTLADFNLDGNLETAALGSSSGYIAVGSTNVWVGDYAPISIGVGDVNLDGRPDFMTSNLGANCCTLSVLLNDTATLQFGASPAFPNTLAWVTSETRQVTLTNLMARAVEVSSVEATADFAVVTHDCTTLAPAGSCTVLVNFRPTGPGTRGGSLLVASDAPGSPYALTLSGSAIDVALSLARAKRSARAASTSSLQVTTTVHVPGNVTTDLSLTCEAPGMGCQVSPALLPRGSRNANVTLRMTRSAQRLRGPQKSWPAAVTLTVRSGSGGQSRVLVVPIPQD